VIDAQPSTTTWSTEPPRTSRASIVPPTLVRSRAENPPAVTSTPSRNASGIRVSHAAGAQAIGGRAVDRPAVVEPGRTAEPRPGAARAGAERVARDRVVGGVGDRQAKQLAHRQPGRQAVGRRVVERVGRDRAPEGHAAIAARCARARR